MTASSSPLPRIRQALIGILSILVGCCMLLAAIGALDQRVNDDRVSVQRSEQQGPSFWSMPGGSWSDSSGSGGDSGGGGWNWDWGESDRGWGGGSDSGSWGSWDSGSDSGSWDSDW